MSEGPDAYIQSAEDEWEEETSVEDRLNGVVGGDPRRLNWNYRAAIKNGEEYKKDEFESLEDAYDWIQEVNEEESLGYSFESIESLLVEEKDW